MITYYDKIKRLQEYGVLLHTSINVGNKLGAYCTQTGWLFFEDTKEFVLKQLKLYNIPVIYSYEGLNWQNPILSWPQISSSEANLLREEYKNRWDK